MLMVQMPVMKSSSSKARKCMWMRTEHVASYRVQPGASLVQGLPRRQVCIPRLHTGVGNRALGIHSKALGH